MLDRGPIKQNSGDPLTTSRTKLSWTFLFGSSCEGSLSYTPPKVVGDKIVVIPLKEVITQGV